MELRIQPLTAARFADLLRLFGPNGACGGCWCQVWRLERKVFEAEKGTKHRARLRALARRRVAPGLLAYAGREPVGWVSVAPRADFAALARSRVLAPVDARPVWSVTCLYVRKDCRRAGVAAALLRAAAAFAERHGAEQIEGYPHDAARGDLVDVFAWTGLLKSFLAAGYVEVARRSPARPIVRRELAAAGG